MLDIIIVGAGPAGLTAAIYARRAGKSVMILEKESFGGQIVYSPKIENYPGFLELSGSEFGEKLVDQAIHHGAEIELDEVTEIHDNGKIKSVITPRTQYLCKSVIVAAGSRHRPLGLPREDDLIGHGISYCALCDGDFFKGKDVAVVGGGNTALQNAVLLSETSKSVTIVQNLPKLTGEVSLAQILKARQNVKIVCNTIVTELLGAPELTGIKVKTPRPARSPSSRSTACSSQSARCPTTSRSRMSATSIRAGSSPPTKHALRRPRAYSSRVTAAPKASARSRPPSATARPRPSPPAAT